MCLTDSATAIPCHGSNDQTKKCTNLETWDPRQQYAEGRGGVVLRRRANGVWVRHLHGDAVVWHRKPALAPFSPSAFAFNISPRPNLNRISMEYQRRILGMPIRGSRKVCKKGSFSKRVTIRKRRSIWGSCRDSANEISFINSHIRRKAYSWAAWSRTKLFLKSCRWCSSSCMTLVYAIIQDAPRQKLFRVMQVYEIYSKLLVSPLITPIVVPYIILYNTPFKEFRLWLIRVYSKCSLAPKLLLPKRGEGAHKIGSPFLQNSIPTKCYVGIP